MGQISATLKIAMLISLNLFFFCIIQSNPGPSQAKFQIRHWLLIPNGIIRTQLIMCFEEKDLVSLCKPKRLRCRTSKLQAKFPYTVKKEISDLVYHIQSEGQRTLQKLFSSLIPTSLRRAALHLSLIHIQMCIRDRLYVVQDIVLATRFRPTRNLHVYQNIFSL